jgi:hypothetical protein
MEIKATKEHPKAEREKKETSQKKGKEKEKIGLGI